MDDNQTKTLEASDIIDAYERAIAKRGAWENLWEDCYDYTWPQRGGFTNAGRSVSNLNGKSKMDHIFDATAVDSVDQLAASLLGNLTPIWSQWFGLKPGPDLSDEEADRLAPLLEKAAKTVQDHFDRSNFAVEIHQCYLDLIVGGTASLYFEEAPLGEFSAFKFKACALKDIVLDEGESGYLDVTYRKLSLSYAQIMARYSDALVPPAMMAEAQNDADKRFDVLEAVRPYQGAMRYDAVLMDGAGADPFIVSSGVYGQAPFINFRWLKSPGEVYGRSPVMKALPDIKTANKVVELTLKNASIAVTGIWQADDDGVLNPSNVQLTPGSIIPKAMGSAGLQPLEMPGRFDISQLVLENLQRRIQHALLADRLGPVTGPHMTATEVLERSSQMAMVLGATYGRLQTELLTPLIKRAFDVLKRRGEVPDIALDGRFVVVDYRSPLARSQGQRNVQNTLSWINSVLGMGAEASSALDLPQAARFLGEALGVPSDLIRKQDMIVEAADIADGVRAVADELMNDDSPIGGDDFSEAVDSIAQVDDALSAGLTGEGM